jgi:hypothetical protein
MVPPGAPARATKIFFDHFLKFFVDLPFFPNLFLPFLQISAKKRDCARSTLKSEKGYALFNQLI